MESFKYKCQHGNAQSKQKQPQYNSFKGNGTEIHPHGWICQQWELFPWVWEELSTAGTGRHTAAALGLQWHRGHTLAQGGTQQHSAVSRCMGHRHHHPLLEVALAAHGHREQTSAQGRNLGSTWATSLGPRHCTVPAGRRCQREQTAGFGAAHSAA